MGPKLPDSSNPGLRIFTHGKLNSWSDRYLADPIESAEKPVCVVGPDDQDKTSGLDNTDSYVLI
ncbi:hypothetical protein T265_12407 [Opisthorchis viverrini]|uniref:Uncharacterized protein n=1 Tax=Opisthorchis viverrini TaxID=6198 RepID=A0A074YT67_OPIVI|nr:hypothetical protein T265_12407 [Opisthorchis viverrini]KER17991.1 hypothetical protein T265_12407 [Opisthorchis viverrini]